MATIAIGSIESEEITYVLETTNFGMPPIAEYHVVGDSLGITHVEKIPISFALDRF